MTQTQGINVASDLSVNDNAPTTARGKRGKKPPSGKRVQSKSYPSEIKALTQKIKKIQGQELEARVQIGLGLSRAKELLAHGQFLSWVRREFRWSERTATTWIKLAEHYEGKTAKFADLDLGTATALIAKSTPAEVRDEVFAAADKGEAVSREAVRKRIADSKAALRKSEAKKAEPSDVKRAEAETSPATGKSPEEDVVDAVLTVLRSAERNRPLCKLDDVVLLLWEDKRPLPNKECVNFVKEVLAGLIALTPPESITVNELKLAS